MININLLDWRGKIIAVNNNKFYVVMGVVVAAVVMLSLSVILIINSMVDGEQANVKYLQDQISSVESKIGKIKDLQKQKDLLLSRRAIIETLQASSPFVVLVMDNLAKAIPDGVVLKTLTRTQDQLVVIGSSDTNSQISTLMKNVESLKWVKSYKLNDITTNTAVANASKPAAAGDAVKSGSDSKIDFQLNIVLDPELTGGKTDSGATNDSK